MNTRDNRWLQKYKNKKRSKSTKSRGFVSIKKCKRAMREWVCVCKRERERERERETERETEREGGGRERWRETMVRSYA